MKTMIRMTWTKLSLPQNLINVIQFLFIVCLTYRYFSQRHHGWKNVEANGDKTWLNFDLFSRKLTNPKDGIKG